MKNLKLKIKNILMYLTNLKLSLRCVLVKWILNDNDYHIFKQGSNIKTLLLNEELLRKIKGECAILKNDIEWSLTKDDDLEDPLVRELLKNIDQHEQFLVNLLHLNTIGTKGLDEPKTVNICNVESPVEDIKRLNDNIL